MADKATLLSLAGPLLAHYLEMPDLTDLCCNDNGTAFVTRVGQGKQQVDHPGTAHLTRFGLGVADAVGLEWRMTSPRLSAALDDLGWRIQASMPPATSATFLVVRKHPKHIFSLEDLVSQGVLTDAQRSVLVGSLGDLRRMIIAGGVGSSKTTLLNALLHELRTTTKRVVICEDAPEIQCSIADCTRQWTVKGQWGLRELVQDSLRLNMDLLVVGEVRDGSALDMLKAGQTGHGLLTTLHVDEPEQTMSRLEQLVQEVSVSPQRELIGHVVERVVHMRKQGTSWRCTGILDVERWDGTEYVQRRIA